MKAVCALLSLFAASALATLDDDFIGVYLETPELYSYAGHAARSFRPELSTRSDKYKPGLPGGFKCPPIAPSATVPTDARFVRPSDVQVVGAIGDSLTAANGVLAWTVPTVLKQYRGLSWSVGGDNDINTVLTLPNILKKYNSKLYGFSRGSSYSQDTKDAYYNVARAGNTAVEIVGQSEKLVQKILGDKRQDQWKIITLFIGGNDVCKMCTDRELYSVENYKKNIVTAINNINAALPNTIVNLVAPLDLKNINELPNSYKCKAVHNGLCSCMSNASDPDYGHRLSKQYEAQVKAICDEAPTRWPQQNFAVVYHPMFTDGELPTVDGKPDDSFFAPDCFHFSQKGHETAAYNLWNNMMRPANERLTGLVYNNRTLICPTEDAPYIQL